MWGSVMSRDLLNCHTFAQQSPSFPHCVAQLSCYHCSSCTYGVPFIAFTLIYNNIPLCTHTHTHIYIHEVCVCVCVCVCVYITQSPSIHFHTVLHHFLCIVATPVGSFYLFRHIIFCLSLFSIALHQLPFIH